MVDKKYLEVGEIRYIRLRFIAYDERINRSDDPRMKV